MFIIMAPMQKLLTHIVCAFLMVIIWNSGASASPFHKHEKNASLTVSKTGHHVCEMKHSHDGLICPHLQNKNENHKECHIGPDCGGLPLGATPSSIDYSKNLLSFFNNSSLTITNKAESIFSFVSIYKYDFPFQLDPPPKLL